MKIHDAAARSPVGEAYRVDQNRNLWLYEEIDGEMVVVSQIPGSKKGTTIGFEQRDLDEALHFEDWLSATTKCPRPIWKP